MAGMDVDDLYGLSLDQFVPARTALAKELRSGDRREEAATVAALRKPSVAAWAVNQLVRTQRREVTELFDAGDALRGAQEQVLAGRGDGGSLRAAVEQERAAVERLTGTARGLLTSEGHELSATIIERVSDTLHAAALDDDARAQVQDGRLERELRHVGLGMAAPGAKPGGATPAPVRKPGRRSAGKAPAASGQRAAERAAAERAERERAEREGAADRAADRAAARVAEREARRRVERAERGTKLALKRRDRAAQALTEAEQELQETERELDEARAQLREA
jgi:hypothetical protein